MWPRSCKEWFNYWEADTVLHVKSRLLPFPILRAFANRLAANAVDRAQEIANYLRQYPGYFESSRPYGLWLRCVSYREALRLVLQPESVETILQSLDSEVRRHLRLRYIDQFNDNETARALDLRVKGRTYFDHMAARTQSFAAYQEFHGVLERRTATVGKVVFPVLFPRYPNADQNSWSHEIPEGES